MPIAGTSPPSKPERPPRIPCALPVSRLPNHDVQFGDSCQKANDNTIQPHQKLNIKRVPVIEDTACKAIPNGFKLPKRRGWILRPVNCFNVPWSSPKSCETVPARPSTTGPSLFSIACTNRRVRTLKTATLINPVMVLIS
jgi:hypothetical protein